ncbi:MAG TPA: TolC family protein [Bryobacterales bacterium]|nr:TolC family protein [Bryobacterales bacterium]
MDRDEDGRIAGGARRANFPGGGGSGRLMEVRMRQAARWLALLLSAPLWAQDPLSLKQAIELALQSNPLATAADAGEKEAEARVSQARAGYMPRLGFSESFQRGNNPVYVFGSLLTQHQFTAGNFNLGSLNRPEPLNNYQSRLSVEQTLFDARQTSRGVEAARFTRQMAGEDTRRSRSDIILNALRTYFAVELAAKNLEAAGQSLRSATADLEQAQAVYQSGRSTEAEVLALRVHVASVRQEQIRAANDLAVARAALNDALGVNLDRSFELTTALEPVSGAASASLEQYRRLAAEQRPEIRQAALAQRLAQTQQELAHSAYWPQVAFRESSRPTGRTSTTAAASTG